MKQYSSLLNRLLRFFYDGFRNMPGWGRKVWMIIIIKLFIMFAILRIFFFQDFLYKNWPDDKARSEHVLDQLTNSSGNHDRQH
jgi:hypothetical protein